MKARTGSAVRVDPWAVCDWVVWKLEVMILSRGSARPITRPARGFSSRRRAEKRWWALPPGSGAFTRAARTTEAMEATTILATSGGSGCRRSHTPNVPPEGGRLSWRSAGNSSTACSLTVITGTDRSTSAAPGLCRRGRGCRRCCERPAVPGPESAGGTIPIRPSSVDLTKGERMASQGKRVRFLWGIRGRPWPCPSPSCVPATTPQGYECCTPALHGRITDSARRPCPATTNSSEPQTRPTTNSSAATPTCTTASAQP